MWYKYLPQIMHISLLILILFSCLKIVKEKDWQNKNNILLIAMYGLIVFLLIWENRSRYILTMLPIYILFGIEGINYICDNLFKKIK